MYLVIRTILILSDEKFFLKNSFKNIWWFQKKGVTLHSLFGGRAAPGASQEAWRR